MKANMESRKEISSEASERRAALREAIAFKVYEFDAHGVDMNQRYTSGAIDMGGEARPAFTEDPELVYQHTTFPGARLPHAWLEKDRQRVSTLDLVGKGRFTLLTGIGGDWQQAAAELAAEGFPIVCISIGPGEDFEDPFGDWARLREVADDGAILVRPDQVVAWRNEHRSPYGAGMLRLAVMRLTGR